MLPENCKPGWRCVRIDQFDRESADGGNMSGAVLEAGQSGLLRCPRVRLSAKKTPALRSPSKRHSLYGRRIRDDFWTGPTDVDLKNAPPATVRTPRTRLGASDRVKLRTRGIRQWNQSSLGRKATRRPRVQQKPTIRARAIVSSFLYC